MHIIKLYNEEIR